MHFNLARKKWVVLHILQNNIICSSELGVLHAFALKNLTFTNLVF